MKRLYWLPAAFLATTLVSCGKNEPPPLPDVAAFEEGGGDALPEARDWSETVTAFEGFAGEAFSFEGGDEADLSAIQAEMPDWLSLSWDEKRFESATGATIFENLALTVETEPAFGFAVGEAKVWGLDGAFIAARLRGERLDEAGNIVDRLEASDTEYFGVAATLNAFFDEMMSGEEDFSGSFEFTEFEGTTDRLVMSGLSLRPFEFNPISAEQFDALSEATSDETIEEIETELPFEKIQLVHWGQQALAVSRSFEIERAAGFGTTVGFEFQMTGTEEDDSVTMSQRQEVSIGLYGYEGVKGLDFGQFIASGGVERQVISMDGDSFDETPLEDGLTVEQVQSYDFSIAENVRLDKVAGFFARGELPAMSERDLMSLGTWTTENYLYQVNGADAVRAKLVQVKADAFTWIIPEDLRFDARGVELSLGEVGEMVMSMIPSAAMEDANREVFEKVRTGLDLLDEHGLARIPFDMSLRASWNAENGDSLFRFSSQSEGFGDRIVRLGIRLPAYDDMKAAAVSDEGFETAFEAAFEENFAFIGARYFESDEGGYDKLFGYLQALGKVYQNEGWGATLAGMPPETLRGLIVMGVQSGKSRVEDEFPQAASWLDSIAAYYETAGGSLDIRAEPKAPLTPDEIQAVAQTNDNEAWVEQFGISVTHTPE